MHLPAIERDASVLGVVEPFDELNDRTFARPRRAHNGRRLAFFEHCREPVEHLLLRPSRVPESHISEFDPALDLAHTLS